MQSSFWCAARLMSRRDLRDPFPGPRVRGLSFTIARESDHPRPEGRDSAAAFSGLLFRPHRGAVVFRAVVSRCPHPHHGWQYGSMTPRERVKAMQASVLA